MKNEPLILAVDCNPRNLELLAQFLGREGYRTLPEVSLEELDRTLAHPEEIALALVDISGFDRRIWERCERLRARRIPYFVLTCRQNTIIQQESLSRGALGVLVKPLVVKGLLEIIRSRLEAPG